MSWEKHTERMACERVDITVLVVDDDDISLAIVANILISWEYKVLTANNALDALETLREFEGFFDLVITELHISGMNGFEFQNHVKTEFQLPVIMMSADSRKSVMSKSLENGAALYILKPICADDFKDIWQYAMAARKGKLVIENELRSREGESPGEKITFQGVNSFAASSVTEPRRRRKYSKRKSSQMTKEDQSEGSSRALKKPKVVWTTYLHNLFLLAIKQIGLDKAVPKKILEIMNVPNLTRENVASHLQKYRIFLRKVAERGIIEGLSDRARRSRFASGLSATVIKDIQTRVEKLHVPVQQYLKRSAQQTAGNRGTANVLSPSNQGPIRLYDHDVSSSTYVTQLGSGQFPNPLHRNPMLQNQHAINNDTLTQVRLGQSSFGSNGAYNFQQPMLGSYANPLYQANRPYNAGPIFPTYGMGHGIMTSANGLTGGLKYGDPMYHNYGSLLRKHSFSYGPGNGKLGSLCSPNLPWSSTYCPSSNSSGIKLNGGSQMVGTGIKGGYNSVGISRTIKNNSFGLINGTLNANMPVTPLGHVNSGLIQGRSASGGGDGCASELPAAALITNATREENISGNPQLPQQLNGIGNAANEHQYNASSLSEGEAIQREDDLTELFLMLDEMHLLNETEENFRASEFLNSDFSSSCHVMQSLEQPRRDGDVIVPATKSTINLPNEPPTSSDKNPNQKGIDGFADWEPIDKFLVDSASLASNSATEQDWDMELIEALFGTEPN